jgi:protein-tyrosine phosphatase
MKRRNSSLFGLSDAELQTRLAVIRRWVAKPIESLIDPETKVFQDPRPAFLKNTSLLIGNKYHAADVDSLVKAGVTAVLNCASGGISRLPVDRLIEKGIEYHFTNVRQDDLKYPILHSQSDGVCSKHLEIAKELYGNVLKTKGKVMFFCVAGQNRSATLVFAVLLLFGHSLDELLENCSQQRPFVLENQGFQKQLVELEKLLTTTKIINGVYNHGTVIPQTKIPRTRSELERRIQVVEIELLIPGLCTMDVSIPRESSIAQVKQCLVDHANQHLLSHEGRRVAKSWVVLAMFGHDSMYDFPLETDALEPEVQHQRLSEMFGLEVVPISDTANFDQPVRGFRWNSKCRFALVIFSVHFQENGGTYQEPWTFVHTERPGARATLLENNLISTYLRAWDFVTGQAFASKQPIVFSFAEDSRDRRQFMKISTSSNAALQFHAPGEGGEFG